MLPSGTKVWRYKYHFGGRRDKITIGRYPAISLKQARQIHEALQAAVEQGGDPKELEFAGFVGTRVKPAGPTFEAYARQWVDETLFYRSAAYRVQQLRWLESYVFGKIGAMPLSSVQPKQILEILDELRPTPTTAEGVRSLIQRIYNYAIRNLQAESNPALMVRGAVSVPKRTRHRHLLEPELARFWRLIPRQGAHFTTQAATQLLVYTMVRKGELIRSRWGVAGTLPEALITVAFSGLELKPEHVQGFVVVASEDGQGRHDHEQESPPGQARRHGNHCDNGEGTQKQPCGNAREGGLAAQPLEDGVGVIVHGLFPEQHNQFGC